MARKITLHLEDKTSFVGESFGFDGKISGEVVFNTGMMGYPESLTDPSYRGQILVLTYPLIGNYGVPGDELSLGLPKNFESDKIQVRGLVVDDYSQEYSHWNSSRSLSQWLVEQKIPAIKGIDTRALTKRLREKGVMLGGIGIGEGFEDPNVRNLASEVSCQKKIVYNETGKKTVLLVDTGAKYNIIRSLISRGLKVVRVPWDYDFSRENYDGLFLSNGPGDPKMCKQTIANVKKALNDDRPIFGICLGNQILALAAGGDTYKLKYGHRSQNQPCIDKRTGRCYITSQNHGYAVKMDALTRDWDEWFVNANDGTNEGMRHRSRPFMSVQFHPEATPGPLDTSFLFDEFKAMIK